jgi:hypothetical protein
VNAAFNPEADPFGWTGEHSSQYWSQWMYQIGGEGTVQNGFAGPTADETHLTTEFAAGIECRWSTNFAAYTQQVALPAGDYALSFDVENVNASTTKANYENRFFVTVGETTVTDGSTEWMQGKSAWTTHTIRFTVSEGEVTTISLGYGTGSNNFGAGNTPALYVSHLALSIDETALVDAKAALQALIEAAGALKTDYRTTGLDEFNAAISAAQDALDATAAKAVNDAATALTAAMAAFKKANYYINIAAGEYYIIDAQSGLFMAAGHNWGTQGIVNEVGLDLILTPYEEPRSVTIDTRVSNGGNSHFLSNGLWMDSSEWGWFLEYVGFGFYITDGTQYINIDQNDELVLSDTPREWIIVSKQGLVIVGRGICRLDYQRTARLTG